MSRRSDYFGVCLVEFVRFRVHSASCYRVAVLGNAALGYMSGAVATAYAPLKSVTSLRAGRHYLDRPVQIWVKP